MTRTYKPVTKEEVKTIIDGFFHTKPRRSHNDIADEIKRGSSFVYYIINKYENGDTKIHEMYDDTVQSFKVSGGAMHLSARKNLAIDDKLVVKQRLTEKKKISVKKPGVSIAPGKHAAIPHKLNDKYKNLDRKELEFLKGASCSNDFIVAYFKGFGYDVKTVPMLNEVWKRREDILSYEEDKLHHAIVKPRKRVIIDQISIDPRKASPAFHEDAAIQTLSNKISLMNQLYKETIELQKDIITTISKMTAASA